MNRPDPSRHAFRIYQGNSYRELTPKNTTLPGGPKRRRLDYLALIAVLVVGVFMFVGLRQNNSEKSPDLPVVVDEQNTEERPKQKQKLKTTPKTIRLVATGDMIPHDALNADALQSNGSYDYLSQMQNMQKYFKAADIRFCNQAVLGAGKQFGISGYPIFNSPVEFSQDMAKVGCNLINTGSNHTNDRKQEVISASVAVWDDLNMLAVAGANRSASERDKVRYFSVDGVKFAYVSYTTYVNSPGETNYGVTMYSDALAKRQLSEAQRESDFTIVSMRWGTEYSDAVNSTQSAQAKKLADLGADLILGHGSHVLQPVQQIKGVSGNTATVWYSLGNFLNAQVNANNLVNGLAVIDISVKSKRISSTSYLPAYVHYSWPADQKTKGNLMARTDFEMHLLEDSAKLISGSHLHTSMSAEMSRVKSVLNKFTNVPILTGSEYPNPN